jgi:hypothetical protein
VSSNASNYPASPTHGKKACASITSSDNLSSETNTRSVSSASSHNVDSTHQGNANSVRHGKRPGQIYMTEGIVDMNSFGQILAMDDNDPTREFSKALVWAWCEQAEMSVEQMDTYLQDGAIDKLCDKAHYLKGSSASLGLVKVSQTCQSIYHSHFPPSLAHLRAFSYTGRGNSELSSNTSGSGSGSSASASSNASPLFSPPLGSTPYESDSSFTSYYPSTNKRSPAISPSYISHDDPFKFPVPAASTPTLLDSPELLAKEREGTGSGIEIAYIQQSPSPNAYAYEKNSFNFVESAPLTWTTSSSSSNSGDSRGSGSDQENSGAITSTKEALAKLSLSTLNHEENYAHFEREKVKRVKNLLDQLKNEIKQSSEWLYTYYRESDKYAGVTSGSG